MDQCSANICFGANSAFKNNHICVGSVTEINFIISYIFMEHFKEMQSSRSDKKVIN